MLPYTIDDAMTDPLTCSVEVTIDFGGRKRWLFFATPQLLASVGDWVPGTRVRLHLGERHMVVVSELSPAVIDAVLRQLHAAGELEGRTLPLVSRRRRTRRGSRQPGMMAFRRSPHPEPPRQTGIACRQ